jgi:hypothetical protein
MILKRATDRFFMQPPRARAIGAADRGGGISFAYCHAELPRKAAAHG